MWTLIAFTLMAEGEWTGSGGAPVYVSDTPWDAQQRDRKRSQMEGGEAAERML